MTPDRLFIDLDGVLADFDKGYEAYFGEKLPPRAEQGGVERDIKWGRIRETPGFFRNLPMMPGAMRLWNFASRHRAYIITGAPDRAGSNVALEKRQWVHAMLDNKAPVICCPSSEKSLFCRPGDVLVDDWVKYKHRWTLAGGIWVTFTDYEQAIEELRKIGYD